MLLDFMIEGYLNSNDSYALLAAFASISPMAADCISRQLSTRLRLGSMAYSHDVSRVLVVISDKPLQQSGSLLLSGFGLPSGEMEEWPLYEIGKLSDCFSPLPRVPFYTCSGMHRPKVGFYVTWSGWWEKETQPEWCLLSSKDIYFCWDTVVIQFQGQRSLVQKSLLNQSSFFPDREDAQQVLRLLRSLRVGDVIQTTSSTRSLCGTGITRQLIIAHTPRTGPFYCMAHCTLDQVSAWTPTPYCCGAAHTTHARNQELLVLNDAGKHETLRCQRHTLLLHQGEDAYITKNKSTGKEKEEEEVDPYAGVYACLLSDPCRNLFRVTKTLCFYRRKLLRLTCVSTGHDFLISRSRFQREFCFNSDRDMLQQGIQRRKQRRDAATEKLRPGDFVIHTSHTESLRIVELLEDPAAENSRLYRCCIPHSETQTPFLPLHSGSVSDAVLVQDITQLPLSKSRSLCLGDLVFCLSTDASGKKKKTPYVISRIITGADGDGDYGVVLSHYTPDGKVLHLLESRLKLLRPAIRQSDALCLFTLYPQSAIDSMDSSSENESDAE